MGTVWDSGHPFPKWGHRLEKHPRKPPLTLALPAPCPMGFMIVYMFSLELVESGGDQKGARCDGVPPNTPTLAHPHLLLGHTSRARHDGCSRGPTSSWGSLHTGDRNREKWPLICHPTTPAQG